MSLQFLFTPACFRDAIEMSLGQCCKNVIEKRKNVETIDLSKEQPSYAIFSPLPLSRKVCVDYKRDVNLLKIQQ